MTIVEWDESPRLTRISATIHVERAGHKPIIMGTGASRLVEIGTAARLEAEALFGKKIFLKLFVKVSEKWRDSERFLNELDWRTNYSTAEPEIDVPTSTVDAGNEHNGEE